MHDAMALDYEIVCHDHNDKDGRFQVWTPDICGGCIGSGATREESLLNCIANLGATISHLAKKSNNPNPK